jgi:antitoxin MazE
VNARVQRWGNSLAIRIPRAYASDLGVSEGSEVELVLDGRALVVTPSTVPPLDALLEGITDTNRHEAFDFGAPEGRETW